MKLFFVPAIAVIFSCMIASCGGSASKPQTFCDTACLSDSLKFAGTHKLKPYVYISTKNCVADSLAWSYSGMGVNRKVGLADFLNTTVHINKNYLRCVITDTANAWILFNDCISGRGYQLKLPFNKTATIGRKSSGINNLDKKFSIDDGIVAYTDRGNIFTEEMATGKKAMMTFGKNLDIDYDVIHDYIDSVNITPTRIWVKVKVDGEWKELEKKIVLQ